MKLLICLSLCTLIFASFIDVAKAYNLRGRGAGTVMSFGNSTTESIEKRANRGTWYHGEDLKNAACYDRNGLPSYSASDSDMIGAMAMNDFENCYKCMKITNNKNKNTVVVKIIDKCAGCQVNKAIDLTPAAFKELNDDLNVGVLDISWKAVSCPSDIEPKMGPKKE